MKQLAQSRGAVDHTARAKRLRDRAEECRTLARIIPLKPARQHIYVTLKITTHLPNNRSGLRAKPPNSKSTISKDEARRIAVSIAKLPELVQKR